MTRSDTALLLALALSTSSCGGGAAATAGTETVAAPAPARDVWEGDLTGAFPATTDMVVRVNGQSLRSWRGWAQVSPMIENAIATNGSPDGVETRVFRAMFTDAREFAGGFHVGSGRGDEQGIGIATLSSAANIFANHPTSDAFGYQVMSEGGSAVALLDSSTIVLCGTDATSTELQRLKSGDFANVWTNEQMRALRDSLNGEHATATLIYAPAPAVREEAARDAARELQLDTATAAALASMQAVSVRVDAAESIQASVFIDVDSDEHAALLASRAQALVRGYASNLAIQIAGLSPILNHVVITSSGRRVTVQLTISPSETDALIARLQMIAG